MFGTGELHTETFTNSRGWTIVRVTHLPSGVSSEREHSKELVSSVQAQNECIAELRVRLGDGAEGPPPSGVALGAVSRGEFEALAARVEDLERRLR